MAATERRVGPSRRGMTVLGKVPVVPKPVNLPSQRLENQGLFRDVDIVPRGSCSWGSAGRFPGVCSNKSRNSDSASSNSLNSGGKQDDARKVENKPVSATGSRNAGVKDGGGLLESSVQFSSAKITTGQALDSNQKIEGPRNSNSYTCDSLDSQKQEKTTTPLQNSGDGYVCGVSVPPGFVSHGNQSRAGVSAPDLQCNGIRAGMYPNISQQNGLHSFPGVPHQNGKKEREIIVVHMVGSPGFYGNYPPQLGYPDTYGRNGLYGNFPLQFGNFEPYFGFQGHCRLDGGPQMSTVKGSDVFDEHEDFICYEKECYQGRKKNGLVRGSFQESTSLGGSQRNVHEAVISHSSLKPRCISQKHSARNTGRLRSLYHNGRLVPIEEASSIPIPEKRITLLTKVSQPKRLTIESLDETVVSEVVHAEEAVGSALLACGDEGKAPETCETDLVDKETQVEQLVSSGSLKMTDEKSLPREMELGSDEVSALATTCNNKCLHCKAGAAELEGPALMVCQACKKAIECENTLSPSQCCLRPTKEEVLLKSIDISNSTDGCTVEVKHVIFDADSSSLSRVKGQEDSSSSSSMQAAAADEQLDTMILKKSLKQNNQEGKSKLRLLGKKGITDGKWKPKRPVGAAKVDFKVLAPKIRKAAGRRNTSKTFSGECVSEASSSSMYKEEDSPTNLVADSIILPSQTETCDKCQESSSPSLLSSKGDAPVDDDSQELIASQGQVPKKKGRGQRKTTPRKDCNDNVENLVKAVFEDISNTEVQKQEPKGADIAKEKAWRPKLPTALQYKSATKVSGIRVNKAHVVPRKIELEEGKLSWSFGATCFADSSEAAKEDGNAVQKSNCLSTSQLCSFEVVCQNNQADTKSSEATSKYHMVRRRVYHVVEGSGGDYFIPSPTISGKLYPKGSYRSLQTTSMQNQAELSKKKVPVLPGSSCTESECSEEFSEFMSVVGIKSRRSQSNSVSCSEVAANQCSSGSLLCSSGFEKTKVKKHIRPGERLAAWKPKATPEPAVLQKGFQKKDTSRSGTLISAHAERASEEIKDLAISSQISTSGHLHTGEYNEEHTIENVNRLPLELESVNCLPFEEVKYPVNQEDTPPIVECKEVLDCQLLPETMVPVQEVDHSSILKHVQALPTLVSSLKEEVQVQQTTQICSQENTSGSHRPFEEVKHLMNQEDTPLIIECKEVLDSQNLSETMASMEEVDHGSVLKDVEELPTLVSSLKEEVQVQQTFQTCSQENAGGSCRPFFKKKNVMSYEKANRYHQMMFKKYKETGHWKPKADRHGKLLVEKDRASQNSMEAAMNSVPVIA